MTLARARRGEEAACRALFRQYHGQVFALLWRVTVPRASAPLVEDLTQDTFLRVFAGLGDFDSSGPARLSTWILTIATNLALNELRRQRRSPIASAAVEAPDAPGDQRADAATERRALGAILTRELARLSPEHRIVFLLREYHELSYEEIAQALAIELGTVQSRLSRARAALRRALEEIR